MLTGKTIFLDLDGVMADFDADFKRRFGLESRGAADAIVWKHINGEPTFFRDLPPCPGAIDFYKRIEFIKPVVLTACPSSNYQAVARQKRGWVREHLGENVMVLPVMGGKNKPLFMHRKGDLLIDDWERNIVAWEEEGGIAIHHTNFEDTEVKFLEWYIGKQEAA